MRRMLWILALIVVVGAGLGVSAYRQSRAFLLTASDDRYQLWMAAIKGFSGTPRYVGSIGDQSFFRVGDLFVACYKAPTARVKLPYTFPVGGGEPYQVTAAMVPPD